MKNTFLLSATFLALSASSLLASPQATHLNHSPHSSMENIFSIYNRSFGEKTCKALSFFSRTSRDNNDRGTLVDYSESNCYTKTLVAYFSGSSELNSGAVIHVSFCKETDKIRGVFSLNGHKLMSEDTPSHDGSIYIDDNYYPYEPFTTRNLLRKKAKTKMLDLLKMLAPVPFLQNVFLAEIDTYGCTIKPVYIDELIHSN